MDKNQNENEPDVVRATITNRAPGDRVVHSYEGVQKNTGAIRTKAITIRSNETVTVDMVRAEFDSAAGMDGIDIRPASEVDDAEASGDETAPRRTSTKKAKGK